MGQKLTLHEGRQMLDQVERDLDSMTYRVGDWQKCLKCLKGMEVGESSLLSQDLTRVSNKLHRRNQFLEAPAWVGFIFEYLLLASSLLAMTADSILLLIVSVVILALCLQPLIKTYTGLLLGVRYSYVFLWYFEPRFKMQFGSYHELVRWKKLLLQLSGSVGTPIALLVGWRILADAPLLSTLCLGFAAIAALMQVAAFVAVLCGVRKVGPFLLSNLTTPALLAKELKER
ncbi:MAG: hypothetical protein ACJAVI_002969 [Candidatus Azotimanducaceae bacterium]|jgi:hypothetical protein